MQRNRILCGILSLTLTTLMIFTTMSIAHGEDRTITGHGNNMSNMDSNYVFLYDHDGHYSKLKIVNSGGGVAGEPFWVQVQWYYNNTLLDNRF